MHNQKLTLLAAFGAMVLVACGDASSSVLPSSSGTTTSSASTSQSSSLPEISEGSISSETGRPSVPLANSLENFSLQPFSEKAKILGELEKYAQDEFIAGIPMYDSSGNLLYNDRLTIPSDVFIPNYGFGVGEGTIESPLTETQQPVAAYRNYFHSWQQTEPVTLNHMNDQTSVVSDLAALFTSSYFGTRFNNDKTGYEWYPVLSRENRPTALDPDAVTVGNQTYSFKWSVPLKTTGVKYSTLSTVPAIAAFDGREVELEDYLTPFRLMLEEEWVRATDLASETSGFAGVQEFLDGEIPFEEIEGIQLNTETNSIEFEFNAIQSTFYAMYSLASSLYSPIPQEFIDALATLPGKDPRLSGADMLGLPTRIVDTLLSVGIYEIEEWQPLKSIVFKKNADYLEANRYSFEGYHYAIIPGGANVAFSEFLAGKLDAVGIPATRLQEFKSDTRRRQTLGATTFKIQVNATDQATWEELFGEVGSVLQTPVADYYEVKPIMSNKDFLNGVYFSINREDLAEFTGRNPAQAFFSDAYMIDPELGVSWRSSDEGKAAYANRSPETFGYSRELAKAYFRRALTELTSGANPAYTPGTADDPTIIELDVHMQTQVSVDNEGTKLKDYIETVFNTVDPRFKLVLNTYATANWFDVYYNSMLTGQFDMAVGAISGNTLNPLQFMDVLTSDQRTGFTLSWGPDTNEATQTIQYDGKAYSYDALFEASQKETLVLGGATAEFAQDLEVSIANADEEFDDGVYDMTLTGKLLNNDVIESKEISRLSLTGGSSGTFNWTPGAEDNSARGTLQGNFGLFDLGDLDDVLDVVTSPTTGETTFTATITDIPKELGPKNFSINTSITTNIVGTGNEPISAAYSAIPKYGEDFFTGLAPANVFAFTGAELDETNPVKILFNDSVGGIVKGAVYNSELVSTEFEMIALYSYAADDFVALFADLEGLGRQTDDTLDPLFGDILASAGFDDFTDILRINDEGQFVIYIQDLPLGDQYSFDVFYNVSWSNELGTYTSSNYVWEDIPVPGSAFGLVSNNQISDNFVY
jgi:hypothetical protein